jgi:hypothetical protein
MRKPYSAPNYEDPVEYLTPPEYWHTPFEAGDHKIRMAPNMSIVRLTVDAGPKGSSIIVIVRPRGE